MRLGTARQTKVCASNGDRLWRTAIVGAVAMGVTCDWCGSAGGLCRLYAYNWGHRVNSFYASKSNGWFCSLHCWGQRHGFTDL